MLHLLPHSHVDIGYSDPQPEVERKQWKNLRDAVELARKTASYPPEARFKWNVEGLWSVESYLKQASPEEREAFLAAVRNGTIALQANDTNILTGLATPEELRHWTAGSRRLRAAYGLEPGRTAMHSDIPGLSWTSVAALAEAGRALLQQRPELHARPARRRRPHRRHAEGAGRQAVLVDVALRRGAAALLDGGPRLFVVPRPQHGPHDRSQPRRRAAST